MIGISAPFCCGRLARVKARASDRRATGAFGLERIWPVASSVSLPSPRICASSSVSGSAHAHRHPDNLLWCHDAVAPVNSGQSALVQQCACDPASPCACSRDHSSNMLTRALLERP